MLNDNIPDTNSNTFQEMPQEPPPPAGDSEKAEKYLSQLIGLIKTDKLEVIHTDLKKFDIASIQDHYRMDLGEYEVEVNHSKQPDTGQDFYVLLFNNLKKIEEAGESCISKVILAYTHLTHSQFVDFKEAADGALERKRKKEEEKRFASAMAPIDNVLHEMASSNPIAEQEEKFTSDQEEKADIADEADQDVDLADFEEESDSDTNPKSSDFTTPHLTS